MKGQSWLNFSKLFFHFLVTVKRQNMVSTLFLFYFCKIHVGFVVNQLIKKSLALAFKYRPMEINFLVLVSTCMAFFFRVKSISSFVADCFFQQQSTQTWQDWHLTVLKWIIWVRFCAIILTIQRCACSLKLWNEVPINEFQTSLP